MRVSRLSFTDSLSTGASIEIGGESAHYVYRVLRLKNGDLLRLFNATDGEYSASITAISRGQVLLQVEDRIANSADPSIHIHLGLGLSRGERMDYAIQKSTELGVSAITPLVTEHCEVKLSGDRVEKKLSHWRKICVSASEQCGRTKIPEFHAPQKISNWLTSIDTGNVSHKVLLDHRGNSKVLDKATSNSTDPRPPVILCIGPEGGFSNVEIDQAEASAFVIASLGPRILRTETAPVSAISIIQYLMGDF